MSWIRKIAAGIKGNEDFNDLKSSTLRDIIDGNILTKNFFKKQYPLLLMISFLAFVYVDNRYYCEMQLSQAIKLKQEIQDIKYESLTISAQLMAVSRQSNIRAMVREKCIDLRGSNVPPVVIYVKKLEE